jgi:group I intron endonuclease
MECNNYKVYIIKSLINGKVYIGFTKHTLKHRLSTHFRNSKKNSMVNNKFANAILKHGINNFIIELLFECDNKDDSLNKEIFYIKEYDSIKNGYNSSKGGEVGGVSGKHADFKGEKNPFYGKKHSEETKLKISQREYNKGSEHHFFQTKTKTSFREGDEHPNSIQITINGVKYGSILQACKMLNLHRRKIIKLSDNPI